MRHPMYTNRSELFATQVAATGYKARLLANGYKVGTTSVQPMGEGWVVWYN